MGKEIVPEKHYLEKSLEEPKKLLQLPVSSHYLCLEGSMRHYEPKSLLCFSKSDGVMFLFSLLHYM